MNQAAPQFLSFGDLMAKVGGFLFYWSSLEQELTNSIREARKRLDIPASTIRGSLAGRLQTWFDLVTALPEHRGKDALAIDVREQTLALKDVRNLIVHGLQGGNSMPVQGVGYIRCVKGGYDDPEGEAVQITGDQLADFNEGLDACRRAVFWLDNFNYRITLPVSLQPDERDRCR